MKFLLPTRVKKPYWLMKTVSLIAAILSLTMGQIAKAQTIVTVETSLGNFSIELFDSTAPATVANFLSYVNSGRYNGTFMHRAVSNFVLQGGFWVFNESLQQVNGIQLDPPVVNEFGVSNTRGTLAMAKLAGDPNSATSQWFVNLADNSANLDAQNGGFTVFGRVIEPGMAVVDAISNLPIFNINGVSDAVPLSNYSGGNVATSNFVNVQMSVSTPPEPIISNSFDEATGQLALKVALDGSQFVGASFVVDSMSPEVVIRALPDSVVSEASGDASFSIFSSTDGSLLIPQLYIDGAVAFRNARFALTDGEQFLFTLQSVDP